MNLFPNCSQILLVILKTRKYWAGNSIASFVIRLRQKYTKSLWTLLIKPKNAMWASSELPYMAIHISKINEAWISPKFVNLQQNSFYSHQLLPNFSVILLQYPLYEKKCLLIECSIVKEPPKSECTIQ